MTGLAKIGQALSNLPMEREFPIQRALAAVVADSGRAGF